MKFKHFQLLFLVLSLITIDARRLKSRKPLEVSIGEMIGKGSFGEVKILTIPGQIDQHFAVKFIKSNQEEFLKELDFLLRLCPRESFPIVNISKSPLKLTEVDTFTLQEIDGKLNAVKSEKPTDLSALINNF